MKKKTFFFNYKNYDYNSFIYLLINKNMHLYLLRNNNVKILII